VSGELNVEHNTGIVSTGPNAINTLNQVTLPGGGLRAAEAVVCAPRTAELGPHAAGRLFVGREDELAELAAALADGAGVITTGLGGVGKSTLAHRYAEVHCDRYNPIWWIDAEDPDEIEAGLAALARRLYPDLALLPDPDAAAWGRAWLLCHEGWLLVLDNATDPAHLADLVGSACGGRFLLTSRLTTGWEELAAPVSLGVLTPQQALDLLVRASGRPDLLDGAAQLCEALGYLPLAVRIAAAYMKENSVSAADYLARLASPGGEVIAWTPTAGDPERTLARIWLVSLRRITEHHGALAQDVLRVLAWFAPTDIPVPMLYMLTDRPGSDIDEALGRLAAYALITRDGDAVSVHRMVQAAARHATTSQPAVVAAVDEARDLAVAALRCTITPYDDPAGWPLWRRLMPHIDALVAHAGPDHDDHATLLLLNGQATFLAGQGQVERAIAVFERTATAAAGRLGPDHPDILTSRNNLAEAYHAAGDPGRAVPLHERTLADRERVLGPDHLITRTVRENLQHANSA
jgi:hypothetical protein